jgi:hypothetical protein
MPWELTGNAGTNPANDFLGTTDNQPLVIRTDGQDRLRVTPDGNIGIGTTNPTTATGGRALHVDNPSTPTNPGGPSALRLGNGAQFGQQWEWQSTVINGVGAMNLSKLTPPLANPLTVLANGNVGIGTLSPGARLSVNGDVEVTGDIRLLNADCAEDFDVAGIEEIEPGTVVVIDEEGAVKRSLQAYDTRVAGVISGASGLKPGIILDKQKSSGRRLPLALMGKVACKVDARYSPIEVGDLLTTSPTAGYAMKAKDSRRAFGAVLGKALRALNEGTDTIPVMVALQ